MPSRRELLADHYLKAAGVATVSVDADGVITAHDAVGIKIPVGRMAFCCGPGDEERLASLLEGCSGDQAAVAARLEQLADEQNIGLTPHRIVARRALAAVDAVNAAIAELQATGGMKGINHAFKAARKETPSLRYHDYLHARKASMLDAMAREL